MTDHRGMREGREPLSPGGQLCFSVYAASHAFNRVYKRLLGDLGLTYPQYLVLLVLWEAASGVDDLTVGRIGERLGLDSGTLTPLLKRMEQAGLIVRRRDPSDERQVRVGLAARGLAMRERARSVPRRIAVATGLDAARIEAMRKDLERLRDNLEVFAGIEPGSRPDAGPTRSAAERQPRGV